jgi:hypothetical protein
VRLRQTQSECRAAAEFVRVKDERVSQPESDDRQRSGQAAISG